MRKIKFGSRLFVRSIQKSGTSLEISKPWNRLTETERQAWKLLDRNEQNWKSGPLRVAWKDLNPTQRSAVQYGLGLDENSWNNLIQMSTIKTPTSTSFQNSLIGALKGIGPVAMVASSAIRSIRKIHPAVSFVAEAVSNIPHLLDTFSDRVYLSSHPDSEPETIVYLDDSGSMKPLLSQAASVLKTMSPLIQQNSRLVKFGTSKTVIAARGVSWNQTAVSLAWDASSGATYMWKMIEEDILERYSPSSPTPPSPSNPSPSRGRGRLRVVVVTDGVDCLSPPEYRGIRGMDPMMRVLLSKGFDVDWHIVLLQQRADSGFFSKLGSQSLLSAREVGRYQSLARATGGSFLLVREGEDSWAVEERMKGFIENLKGGQAEREVARRRYRLEAERGREERFDWLLLQDKPKDKGD